MAAVLQPKDDDDYLKLCRDEWVAKLDDEDKAHKQYRDLAKDANDAYFAVSCPDDDAVSSVSVAYPLFWSIVQVLHGRVFSQPPTPDVRKRYVDEPAKQPVGISGAQPTPLGAIGSGGGNLSAGPAQGNGAGGVQPGVGPAGPGGLQAAGQAQLTIDDNKIAECIERFITYVIDTTTFDADGHAAVNDLLVQGGGVAKVEIDVETEDQPVVDPTTGEPLNEVDDAGETVLDDDTGKPKPATQKVIIEQCVRLRHFSFAKQFRWEPQQHWSTVSWIAFMHGMTADQIMDEWGITLSAPGGTNKRTKDGPGSGTDTKKPQSDKYERLFDVYEIWDKAKREVVYLCPQHDKAFEIRHDPLKLKDFYPCPKPMMLNIAGDDLVPQPDYAKCESLFNTANETYGRIDALTKSVKDVGFYDSAFPELAGLMTERDGALIPVSNILKKLNDINPGNAQLGYDAVVFKQDNTEKVKTIAVLMQQLAGIEDKIWKSYGVADIQRGSSDPNETATAQNIKSQWADIRVGQRIRIVALFFRDVFRIMADIGATFPKEILAKMTGIDLNDAEYAVLQDDVGRCYIIDIESDSTAAQDEAAQQQNRMSFTQAMTGLIKELGPLMAANQLPADLGKELILVVCNAFKIGRQIEDSIDNLPSTLQQLTSQNQQIQQLQQQLKQAGGQVQAMQRQLQGINMGKEQRDNVKTAVDAQNTSAKTEHEQVLTAKDAEEVQGMADEHARNRVLPFVQPPPRQA